MKSIKEIVKEYLQDTGYDGLCNGDCGCGVNDLMPCDQPVADCIVARNDPERAKSVGCSAWYVPADQDLAKELAVSRLANESLRRRIANLENNPPLDADESDTEFESQVKFLRSERRYYFTVFAITVTVWLAFLIFAK